MTKKSGQPKAAIKEGTAHPVEWAVGGLSALLILGLLGFLLYQAFFVSPDPPRFAYEIGRIERAGDAFRVPVAVTNQGTETAAGVRLSGMLERDGAVAETAEIEFDYIPRHSTRHGAFLFSADPGAAQLRVRVLGYSDP
ncbi:TIGR02588 family protein [Paramesorhizobium deserti]|nr:TIGR02588 family protein [Paramesorhizobium deserti]